MVEFTRTTVTVNIDSVDDATHIATSQRSHQRHRILTVGQIATVIINDIHILLVPKRNFKKATATCNYCLTAFCRCYVMWLWLGVTFPIEVSTKISPLR